MGDALAANVMLMGFAWQKGLIPLSLAALEGAIELNGVAVPFNKQAFALGRLLAHDPARVEALLAPPPAVADTLDARIDKRVADLTAWGDAAYAARYQALVNKVRAAEAAVRPGSEALTEAVARAAHKLMAYKDEYEVARLMTDGRFDSLMGETFSKAEKRTYHLSPPIFAKVDPATGRPKKYAMPGWLVEPLFRTLAGLKGLRGTALDPFGRNPERVAEREAIPAYEAEVERLLAGLTGDNLALAVEIARLPLDVRGFGPVKEAAHKAVEAQRTALWAKWPGEAARAAA
jgi:indolepyruvate ferredoxin oxidoreductase